MPFDGGLVRADRHAVSARKKSSKASELAKLIKDQTLDASRRRLGSAPRLRDSDQVADAPSAKARIKRADEPDDFDPELGLIVAGPPGPPPSERDRARWVELTTALLPLLGSCSAYRAVMPAATPPDDELIAARGAVDASLIAALPELEALHRKLLPGWREIVEDWFGAHARRKLELRHREERQRDARTGKRVNTFQLSHLESGDELLVILRRNPEELMGTVPSALTGTMLDLIAASVQRATGGRNGGWVPRTAMAMLDDWIASPTSFPAAIKRREGAKAKRREIPKKTKSKKRRGN